MSSSTPLASSGATEAKALSNATLHHVRQVSSHATSNPAKGVITGIAASPAPSSAATFVKMAAATLAAGEANHEGSTKMTTRAERIGTAKSEDSLMELKSNTDAFLDVQLDQLEKAGNAFFDQYENALSDHSDLRKVVEAHWNLLALYDQLLAKAYQSALSAIPCAKDILTNPTKTESLDEVESRLTRETKEIFERRERIREGASMVTGVLMQKHHHK